MYVWNTRQHKILLNKKKIEEKIERKMKYIIEFCIHFGPALDRYFDWSCTRAMLLDFLMSYRHILVLYNRLCYVERIFVNCSDWIEKLHECDNNGANVVIIIRLINLVATIGNSLQFLAIYLWMSFFFPTAISGCWIS